MAKRAFPLFLFLAALGLASIPGQALAQVCGNGVVESGELCDDGNTADGDCCTSACGQPTGCLTAGKTQLIVKNLFDNREDRLFWKWMRGTTTFEDFGQPHVDTDYSFCIWDDDQLVLDAFIQSAEDCRTRPCWTDGGRNQRGYRYDHQQTNAQGIRRIRMDRGRVPGKGFIHLGGVSRNLELPDAVSTSQYFNSSTAVTVQYVGSNTSVCYESVFDVFKKNKEKWYKAVVFP